MHVLAVRLKFSMQVCGALTCKVLCRLPCASTTRSPKETGFGAPSCCCNQAALCCCVQRGLEGTWTTLPPAGCLPLGLSFPASRLSAPVWRREGAFPTSVRPSSAMLQPCAVTHPPLKPFPVGGWRVGSEALMGQCLRGQLKGCRGRWHPAPEESGSNCLPPPCTRVCDPLPLPAPEQDAAFAVLTVAGKQRSSTALSLQAITIFPCICPGLDASPPASTHELTIPNDVSKSKCFLKSVCVCKLQAYDFVKYV